MLLAAVLPGAPVEGVVAGPADQVVVATEAEDVVVASQTESSRLAPPFPRSWSANFDPAACSKANRVSLPWPLTVPTANGDVGKILRINKDGSIPSDNPFFNGPATGANRSIWALGLRNPFSFAFQPGTDRMFINDVGAQTWEEINDGEAGANYGWPTTEGPHSNPSFENPLLAYMHDGTRTRSHLSNVDMTPPAVDVSFGDGGRIPRLRLSGLDGQKTRTPRLPRADPPVGPDLTVNA